MECHTRHVDAGSLVASVLVRQVLNEDNERFRVVLEIVVERGASVSDFSLPTRPQPGCRAVNAIGNSLKLCGAFQLFFGGEPILKFV